MEGKKLPDRKTALRRKLKWSRAISKVRAHSIFVRRPPSGTAHRDSRRDLHVATVRPSETVTAVPRELATLFGAPALREIPALTPHSFARLLCRTACALVCAQPGAEATCYGFYDDLAAMRQGADADAAFRAKLLATSSAGARRLLALLRTKLRARGVYAVVSDTPTHRALFARPEWLWSADACDELLLHATTVFPASVDAEEGFIERMRLLGEVEYVRPSTTVETLREAGPPVLSPRGVGPNSAVSAAHGVVTREAIERDMDHREHWCGVKSTAFLLAGEAFVMVTDVVGVEIEQHVTSSARNGVSTFRHGHVKSGALARIGVQKSRHRRGRIPDGCVVLNKSALELPSKSDWRTECMFDPTAESFVGVGGVVRHGAHRTRAANAQRATNIFAGATEGKWGAGLHRERMRQSTRSSQLRTVASVHAMLASPAAAHDDAIDDPVYVHGFCGRRSIIAPQRRGHARPLRRKSSAALLATSAASASIFAERMHIAAAPNPFYDRCQLLLRSNEPLRGSARRCLSPAQRTQVIDEICSYWERTLALVPLSHSTAASATPIPSGARAATDASTNGALGGVIDSGNIDLDAIAQGTAGAEALLRIG